MQPVAAPADGTTARRRAAELCHRCATLPRSSSPVLKIDLTIIKIYAIILEACHRDKEGSAAVAADSSPCSSSRLSREVLALLFAHFEGKLAEKITGGTGPPAGIRRLCPAEELKAMVLSCQAKPAVRAAALSQIPCYSTSAQRSTQCCLGLCWHSTRAIPQSGSQLHPGVLSCTFLSF